MDRRHHPLRIGGVKGAEKELATNGHAWTRIDNSFEKAGILFVSIRGLINYFLEWPPKVFPDSADLWDVRFLFALAVLLAGNAAAQSPPPAAAQPPAGPPPNAAELQRASLDQQRAAARKQAELTGARLKPWGDISVQDGLTFNSTAECDAMPPPEAGTLVDTASKEQSVDARLLRALIEQESGFRPCAVSPKGAQGLMQLMPATVETLKVDDPFDPKQNIQAGAKFLKQLLDKYGGDVAKALAAYNAGPNTDNAADKIPETKAYVDAILKKIGLKHTDPPSIQTPKPIGN